MDILLIGLAGSLGAISRYLIYLWEKSLPTHNFPLGTLFINLIGCFLAGIVLGLAEKCLTFTKTYSNFNFYRIHWLFHNFLDLWDGDFASHSIQPDYSSSLQYFIEHNFGNWLYLDSKNNYCLDFQ